MPVHQSMGIIQESLVSHGANGFMFEYDKEGRIKTLRFKMKVAENDVAFQLPVEWEKFQTALINQEVKRADDDDYCYRVAWANLRDLVLAQMAFLETEMVEIPQMFLGYAMSKKGKTLYEEIKGGQFLIEQK